MKESARIALTFVRGNAARLGIKDEAFFGKEFHLHVPAGAVPKDGPSAGVTMVTALASLLTGRNVKNTVGMTGEVTLQGLRAADWRPEAEGAGGACGRTDGSDSARAQRTRPGRGPGRRARAHDASIR